MSVLYGFIALFATFVVLVIYSSCVISSRISREEERREIEKETIK